MASPVYHDPDGPFRLVVLADSTSFTGPNGSLIPDDPGLYPSVAGAAIEDAIGRPVRVSVFAHPGAGVRDAAYDITRNPHVMFEMVMHADAVIVGIGSFDHAPVGVPPWIEALVPYVRPLRVRRAVRALLRAAHPWGVRITRGMAARVPAGEFERLFDRVLQHVRSLSWGAPGVVLGPTSHRSAYYGHRHPQHAHRSELQGRIAGRHGFAFVEAWPLVEPWIEKLNVDGIHWPFEAHAAIGRAVAGALIPQIAGDVASPGIPGFEGFSPGGPVI